MTIRLIEAVRRAADDVTPDERKADALVDEFLYRLVTDCLAALPAIQRRVLVALYMDGRSLGSVSRDESFGFRPDDRRAVQRIRDRALKALRIHIEEMFLK